MYIRICEYIHIYLYVYIYNKKTYIYVYTYIYTYRKDADKEELNVAVENPNKMKNPGNVAYYDGNGNLKKVDLGDYDGKGKKNNENNSLNKNDKNYNTNLINSPIPKESFEEVLSSYKLSDGKKKEMLSAYGDRKQSPLYPEEIIGLKLGRRYGYMYIYVYVYI
jgi:hypothetical protein